MRIFKQEKRKKKGLNMKIEDSSQIWSYKNLQ